MDYAQQNFKKVAIELFNDVIDSENLELLKKYSDENCNTTFYSNTLEKMCLIVKDLITDTLITEFQSYRENTVKVAPDSQIEIDAVKNDYFSTLLQTEPFEKFKQKYPVLIRNVERTINNVSIHLISLLYDYKENMAEIQHKFNISGKIISVGLNAGDMHEGKAVTRVNFESGSVFFKPRKLELEKLINSFINKIKLQNGLKKEFIERLRTPQFFESANNTWQENIEYSANENKEDLTSFFYNSGVYLGLFYLLGVSDLHFENIIYTKGTPIFIDLEVITPPSVTDENIEQTKHLLNRSILATALLPMYNESLGLNMSGLFSNEGETTKLTYEVPVEDKNYGWVYETRNGFISPDKNVLELNGRKLDPLDYISYLKDGFREILENIISNKAEFKELLNSADVLNTKIRILLRHTAVYTKFIEASNTPNYLQSFEKQEEIFDILEDNYQPDAFGYIRVQEEIKSMKKGNVPLFYTYYASKNLYMSGKKIINNYFKRSISDEIEMRLNYLDEQMVAYQLYMADLSLTTLLEPSQFDTFHNKMLLQEEEQSSSEEAVLENIGHFLDRQKRTFYSIDGNLIDYYRVDLFSETQTKIDSSKFGLYDTCGFLLTMYKYGKKAERKDFIKISQGLYNNLLNKFHSLSESGASLIEYDMSVYLGLSGLLYTSYFLFKESENEEYINDFKAIYKKVVYVIRDQIKQGKIKNDYISGLSGIITLFSEIQLSSDKQLIHQNDLDEFVNALIKRTEEEKIDGIAHGDLGIAYALIIYAKITGLNKEMKELIESIIINSKFTTNRFEWCHGRTGYIDVLSELYLLLDKYNYDVSNIKKEINLSLNDCEQLFSSDSLSLCHGVFGVVDILLNMFSSEEDTFDFIPNKQEILNKISSFNVKELYKIKWSKKTSVTCDSFMTGAPGIAYELMRIKDPTLKSVMKLKY